MSLPDLKLKRSYLVASFLFLVLFFEATFLGHQENSEVSMNSEAPASENFEDIFFEDYVAAIEPHRGELKLDQDRQPSQTAQNEWKEAKSGQVFTAITDANLLQQIESQGFSFSQIVLPSVGKNLNNAELYRESSIYKSFVDLSTQDIADSVQEENKYRPDWGTVGTTFQSKRRNLDPKWLRTQLSDYELVGILNRMDRSVFHPNTCGEVRLIYRLAYQTEKISSRLPLTVNVVFLLPRKSENTCKEVAQMWTAPSDLGLSSLIENWMAKGFLQKSFFSLAHLKAVETNYQVIRSSAGIRNMLGGTAEYILRVFHLKNDHLERGVMENTPDLKAIAANPLLKKELLVFLKAPENFDLLDRGILKIPDRFLARKMSSFAPHGIGRQENRPFDRIFSEKDFSDMNYNQRKFVRSPKTVLRRLNDLSCVGCHQNRTIAGFHFLGQDRVGTHPLNAIFFAGSGHFRSELVRRQKYVQQVLNDKKPTTDRPFSIAPAAAQAKYGDFCGLPGSAAFADWVCEDGLSCQTIDPAEGEKELGKCFPEERVSGDPCLQNFVTQNHHSLDKMVQPWKELGCNNKDSKYLCQPPGQGFPSGMCTTSCEHMQNENEICGPIAGPGFGNCITNPQKTFNQCLELTRKTASRGRCNDQRSCRNDYVCAKVNKTDGACLPSYFLFQIRVDGHPAL